LLNAKYPVLTTPVTSSNLHNQALLFTELRLLQATNTSYLDFGLKPAVFGCFTNAIAPPPIALESCSRVQTDRAVF